MIRKRTLPASRALNFTKKPKLRGPFSKKLKQGFAYSDCWVEDARLVLLNVQDAVARGAKLMLHTRFETASAVDGVWEVALQGENAAPPVRVRAKAIINAAGPWVSEVLGKAGATSTSKVRWVKGSHIVVPRLKGAKDGYLLPMEDGRVVFVLPFERDYTLIGTTDTEYHGALGQVRISEEEIRYLCDGVGNYLPEALDPSQIIWSYAGVRSLYDDGATDLSKLTRDYVLELDHSSGAPLLSVFGGKLTTYRRLAEHALQKLLPALGRKSVSWTAGAALPGGDLPVGGLPVLMQALQRELPWLPAEHAAYFARTYGTAAWDFLPPTRDGAGEELAAGLYACELEYARRREWARTGEDFLWRRTKWGIHLTESQRRAVMQWFEH